jgi:hypothetical protein
MHALITMPARVTGLRTPRRASLVTAILLAVALGLGACTHGGEAVSERQVNLANQRKVALIFRKNYAAVEKIRFTQEGGKPGLGASWTVNAVVTVQSKEYRQILGVRTMGGEPLPDVDLQFAPSRLLVVFSDGSSEEIE